MHSLDEQLHRLGEQQHGIVATRQLMALGATRDWIRHRVRRGTLVAVHPRVFRIAGAPSTPHGRLIAAVLSVDGDAWISHQPAAALHGLPGFSLHAPFVTVPFGRQARALGGAVHRSGLILPHHVTTVDGIAVTSAARTCFDLCGTVHPKRAERALDTAVAQNITSIRDCWVVLLDLAAQGRDGVVLMRELLLDRGDGWIAPASELEARFFELLRAHNLPQPRRQVNMGDEDGWIGRVDGFFEDHNLIAELDGKLWHSSKSDRRNDAERDRRLRASGRHVVRYDWADITRFGDRTAADLRRRLFS